MSANYKNEGFSLLDLMVALAIAGLLTAMSIPNYRLFVEKSKQSAAKGLLSGIYAQEISFKGEWGSFTARLDAIGFEPAGTVYYNVGFTGDFAPPPAAPQGTGSCTDICQNNDKRTSCNFNGATYVCKTANPTPIGFFANTYVTANTFQAEARARLNGGTTDDVWNISDKNDLHNTVSGL